MKSRCLVLLCFFFCAWMAMDAAENYKFRTLSPDGGFYYDGVKAIEQDKEGFVWVMMDYELYRFDGYRYKKYYPCFAEMSPTFRWIFVGMASDGKGNLYVNTNNGVYRYDRMSDKFEHMFRDVALLKTDGKDRLWVRLGNHYGFPDLDTGEIRIPEYEGEQPAYVNPVFCVHNKDIYTFVYRRVYRYNEASNSFALCLKLPGRGGSIRFAQARMGKMWAYVNGEGLYRIDLSSFDIEECYKTLTEYEKKGFREFYVDRKGMVWMGTMEGLYIFDPATGAMTEYKYSVTDAFSLPNNSVWKIYEDRQENIWIGTYSGKLCYVDLDEGDAFRSYRMGNSGLNYAPVSAFAEEGNYLWIGTEGGGVNRMDKRTGEFSSLSSRQNVASNNIKSLLMDGKCNLWASTFRGGIEVLDAGGREISRYQRGQGEAKDGLLVNDVRKTVLEGDSGMWVAYQYPAPRISYFSFREKSFRHISLDSAGNYDYLFDIMRQGERTLWAISNEALYRLDTQTEEVKKVMPGDSEYLGLFTFCLDDGGNIWIGTIGNGLVKFDTNTLEFTRMEDGLQREVYSIYSICYSAGKLWMGTDDGLCCYDTTSGQLMKFDKRENTQGQVYYPLAVLKGKDGKLYFGGTDGFTVVDPKRITYNLHKPKAVISEFFVDHEPVHPKYVGRDSLHAIVLDYDESNFGFEFSADNYQIPEKNMFRYRLKGYNDNWITVDARQRTVMYSKVAAGTYSFEVCAANNDGVWGAPTVIKVTRRRAPWVSVPAYFCYVLAVLGMAYFVFRHYAEKKRLKMLLYQENVEREKKEQIHQAQLRFFTNISHDFRTPLSLIMAALDKLRREGLKEYYYRILNGNVQRLLNLVNELMDFRTVENGMMKLELEPVEVNNFVRNIAADFTDYAAERKIDFRIECDETLPAEVYADKNIVEKIVMNLLNNAFKYTRDGGSIVLKTLRGQAFASQWSGHYKVGDCMEDAFSIVVSDTGVGISGESISSVFERFYKVNTVNADSHLGTGIGLALVKSLVLLQKGSVSLYSEREKGTDMVVCLPMDSSVFDEADFAKRNSGTAAGQAVPAVAESEPQEGLPAVIEVEQVPSSARRILIVEDNADLRGLIAEALSDEFQVMQAGDGVEALKQMENLEFDLVVSDIMMPRKDGVSLCNDIKGNVETSHIPVILLTAKTSLESKIEGVDSGADLYFEKPIDLTYLKLSIQNVFKNRQQLKEHYAKNYYADSGELATNEQDNKFLKQLIAFIDEHMDQSDMDVNQIAEKLLMSRSKLYTKVKSLTGKSVVEFVLNCRLRRAAKLIIEENMTMREVMLQVGIESQAYFTNSFKKMFGETPTSFANKHKKRE
ncbi:MAG: response regulator [Bacteroides sp.]|nr:response regulator [Bacteroides sp.]